MRGWIIFLYLWTLNQDHLPYARHHILLLIRNHSWILTIHKARMLRKKPLEKPFLDFKKWVKSIQTASYNGARTVIVTINLPKVSLLRSMTLIWSSVRIRIFLQILLTKYSIFKSIFICDSKCVWQDKLDQFLIFDWNVGNI